MQISLVIFPHSRRIIPPSAFIVCQTNHLDTCNEKTGPGNANRRGGESKQMSGNNEQNDKSTPVEIEQTSPKEFDLNTVHPHETEVQAEQLRSENADQLYES